MWSLDRRRAGIALALCLATALGGCQVRPLYAEQSGAAGVTVEPELRRIAVEVQRERVAQELMNQLVFALRGGAALTDPAYRLDLVVTTRKSELAIQEREEVPTANLISVTTTYTLTELATGRVLANDTLYTTVSYDFSSQRFANLRARRDAENRAAKAAAEDIRTRLATVFARGV
jgi:LPS-assembly lipoprotein